MSLYSRYSESSISVSYFSRSSALICSASFSGPFGRVGFHLSPPIVSVSTRWPGLGCIARPRRARILARLGSIAGPALRHVRLPGSSSGRTGPHRHQAQSAARPGCHPPDIDEGIPMLGTRAQLVQRSEEREGAVALVLGEPVTRMV